MSETNVTFRIDLDNVTLNDLILLEDSDKATARAVRDTLARWIDDPEKTEEEKQEWLGNLPISKLRKMAEGLASQLKDLSINPTTGDE